MDTRVVDAAHRILRGAGAAFAILVAVAAARHTLDVLVGDLQDQSRAGDYGSPVQGVEWGILAILLAVTFALTPLPRGRIAIGLGLLRAATGGWGIAATLDVALGVVHPNSPRSPGAWDLLPWAIGVAFLAAIPWGRLLPGNAQQADGGHPPPP